MKKRARDAANKWYYENQDRVIEWRFQTYYGVSTEWVNQKNDKQSGKCAICFGTNRNGKRLVVDHNHETKKVRDLLCSKCNSLIGLADENPAILRSAAQYLERWRDG